MKKGGDATATYRITSLFHLDHRTEGQRPPMDLNLD